MVQIYHGVDRPWLIGGKFENYKTHEHAFTDRNPNPNKAIGTTTNNGTQKDLNPDTYEWLFRDVTNKVNELFGQHELPFSVEAPDIGWFVNYNPKGFQALHRHLRDTSDEYRKKLATEGVGICSAVVCFDNHKISSVGDDAGQFFGMIDDEQYFSLESLAGNIWIFDALVWHGVYPVTKTRRTLNFDFFYKVIDND